MFARCWSSSARWAWVKNSWYPNLGERCRGVSVSSVQMPCRSGSPHGVINDGTGVGAVPETAGVWAEAGVTDTEMTAPTMVATLATVIIELESLSRMMISVQCLLLRKPHILNLEAA